MTDSTWVRAGPATSQPPAATPGATEPPADPPLVHGPEARSSPTAAVGHPVRLERPAVSTATVAWALALLLGLQPVTTDLYLPTLPALTRDLVAPMQKVQLTLSALMLAFGLAQLIWGPVADRIGRRPVLMLGLVLYTVASLGGALSPSVEILILWRVLQGAAMAAAVVCARALVRDLFEPHEGAQVMAMGLSGLAVIAMLSPLLGGVIGLAPDAGWPGWPSWRLALSVLAVAGGLSLAFVVLRLPETLRDLNPRATQWRPLLAQWKHIAGHREFVAWAGLVSCTYGGLFTILAASSFVYITTLGVSPLQYGLALASNSCSYLLGTWVCRRWIKRHGLHGAVARGALFTAASAIVMATVALDLSPPLVGLLLAQWLFTFGHGIHQPCGQTAAVGPFPGSAGAAAALAGFVLSTVAFGIGLWLGWALDASVRPYAWCVAFWGVLTATVAWTLVPRSVRLHRRAVQH